MIKNECKIVRDLFPNYIEKQISDETKEFVDVHIKECKECSKLLNNIQYENINIKSSKKEIDFLKIYNLQMLIAKIIIAILLCIIISTGGIVGYRFIKGAKAYDILTKVSAKKEEFLENTNFVIKEYDDEKNIRTLSVYDDYYKMEYVQYFQCGRFIEHNNETISIYLNYEDKHTLSSVGIGVGNTAKSEYNNILYDSTSILSRDKMHCYTINVAEGKINDTNCYILEERNSGSISRWYIDANTMLIIKFVMLFEDDAFHKNIDFSYEIGTVKKEEIVVTEKDGKLIVNGNEYDYDKSNITKNMLADYLK